MITFAYLLLATSTVTFSGYVPPHAARDGVRFQVAAGGDTDVAGVMRACGVEDFAALPGVARYQFAVPREKEAAVRCVAAHLPAGARLTPVERWTADAEAR